MVRSLAHTGTRIQSVKAFVNKCTNIGKWCNWSAKRSIKSQPKSPHSLDTVAFSSSREATSFHHTA